MAVELADMGVPNDEEALLAGAASTQPARRGPLVCAFIAAFALVSCLTVVGWQAASVERQSHKPARAFSSSLSTERKFIALHPDAAATRDAKRRRLVIEGDLEALFGRSLDKLARHSNTPMGEKAYSCQDRTRALFDAACKDLALNKELDTDELEAFKKRFVAAMGPSCKAGINEDYWLSAGAELERQKPVMVKALVASLNKAHLGFTAKMQAWFVDESVEAFRGRMGYLPVPEGQQSVLNRGRQAGEDSNDLPEHFLAEDKWPMCKDAIRRIHNQGHCGSCWAFGGVASMDSRMCIASNGTWASTVDILSRLYVTSCAPGQYFPGHDGCQGGYPHWPMEFMAKRGIVSSRCLPYYISGEGKEHFDHQDVAPPCETHCQGGYSKHMQEDVFFAKGIEKYDWLTQVHGDPGKIGMMKIAIYEEGPVSFAFNANSAFMGYADGVFSVCTGHDHANHAVYAFGWGTVPGDDGEKVEYVQASNSWGRDWGADGHFRIHPRCVTDVTIAGTIEGNPITHLVGEVDSDVPRDSDNEWWPWPALDECPFNVNESCITDMEGEQENYAANEICVSKALNNMKLKVVVFNTEASYDILRVNGHSYSGTGKGLDGVVVDEKGIKFQSDFSVQKGGFKICAADADDNV